MEQSSPKDNLFNAAWNGDLEVFKELLPGLKSHIAVLRNGREQSVLYCACRNGRVSIVVELLKLRSMTKSELSKPQDSKGSTALHAAGWGDHPGIVALLLKEGANIDALNSNGAPPEREAGPRTLIVFDKFRQGGEAFIQDYLPIHVTKEASESSPLKPNKSKKTSKNSPKVLLSSSTTQTSQQAASLVQSTNSTPSRRNKVTSDKPLSPSTGSIKSVVALPKSLSNIKTILPADWFSAITGLKEPDFRKLPVKPFTSDASGNLLLKNSITQEITSCGKLKIIPVADLLKSISGKRDTDKKVLFRIITRENTDPASTRWVDVAYYQSCDTGDEKKLFQVASNFNGIEAISDDLSPDSASFTEQYVYDRTQGPIASISGGGAAIARVHAAFYDPDKPASEWSQTGDRQINILSNLSKYYPTNNGYVTLTGEEPDLPEKPEKRNELLKATFVCYHENVQVTSGHRTPQSIEITPPQFIDQVFCAAVNIHQGNSGRFNKNVPKVEDKCQFILNTVYDQTYLAAVAHKRTHLFLTLIGGGAFGNLKKWIFSAMLEAHLKYAFDKSSSLTTVTLLLFRLAELEEGFLEELEKLHVPYELVLHKNKERTVTRRWPPGQ